MVQELGYSLCLGLDPIPQVSVEVGKDGLVTTVGGACRSLYDGRSYSGAVVCVPVAPTFHGRDIVSPVAAHLSLGLDPAELGPPFMGEQGRSITALEWPGADKVANQITGKIVAVDSFGNLVTNITREMLTCVPGEAAVAIRCDDHETRSIFSTYAEQPPMTLVAVVGSNDQLELAIVNDSATIMLGVGVGTAVEVIW